jgi:hypothetical protein
MYTARCTRKVLKALQVQPADGHQMPTTALGDWYVNFIHMRRHRLVHFLSDRSLLSVLVPVKTLKTVLDRHVVELGELLYSMGLDASVVRAELAAMNNRSVAKTNSSSILGSMRDLSLNARWILEHTPTLSLTQVSLELSRVPCGPLGMAMPEEAAIELLLERHSQQS